MKTLTWKVVKLFDCMNLHLNFNTHNLTAWHIQPDPIVHALMCLPKIEACCPNQPLYGTTHTIIYGLLH